MRRITIGCPRICRVGQCSEPVSLRRADDPQARRPPCQKKWRALADQSVETI